MGYSVKEIFYTLQGEGANSGRAAVFCRFTGCNLWSGRLEDREKSPGNCSRWCDTDFFGTDGKGGGKFESPLALAQAIASLWPGGPKVGQNPLVVFTGGEPLLQLDAELLEAIHLLGFESAIETNGTLLPPAGINWICVSPKAGSPLVLQHGNELKLIYPQEGLDPRTLVDLDFQHFFLQPMDGPDLELNTRLATRYCLAYPQWRISLQIHKLLHLR